MSREVLHRLIHNGRTETIRINSANYYHHPIGKKRLAGRVDPAVVVTSQFHYLFAKYGPIRVARDYLGMELVVTTHTALEADPTPLKDYQAFASSKIKPQTLKTKLGYTNSDIVLLVPLNAEHKYLMDFMAAFFYVHDHFPGASLDNVKDPEMWKLWLGYFCMGFALTAPVIVNNMADHIQSLDKTMEPWYK
jgi:hypothetical protein